MIECTDISLGHGNSSVQRTIRDLGKTFNKDFNTVAQVLLRLYKVASPTQFCNLSESMRKVNFSLPFANSSGTEVLMRELDQIKSNLNLDSRAAVLEQIILSNGLSVSAGAISFSIYQSDKTQANFEAFWKKEKFCDVEIVIGKSSFKAHRVVLAAASQYLNDHMNGATLTFKEDEVSADTFAAILNFIYTRKISVDEKNLLAMHRAAELFQLEMLFNICNIIKDLKESASRFSDIQLDGDADSEASKCSDKELPEIESTKLPFKQLSSDDFKRQGQETKEAALTHELPNGNASDGEYADSNTPPGHTQADKSVTDRRSKNNKSLVCPSCKERFSQLLAYKLHLLCHDDHPTYKCYKCHFIDTSFEKIREHIHASHSDVSVETDQSTDNEAPPEMSCSDSEDDLVPCDACDRLFRSETELRAHMRTHKKSEAHRTKRTYDCNICHKNFRSSSHLKRHMLSHTGERKYCCITCGKLFLKSDHLKRHERIHTSERPFTCEKCGKTFRDKDHLKRHDLTHTQERPYFCEMCGKQFKDKSTLISHQKCHDDAAIFCDVCGKLFRTAEKLESHAKKHSETKPHSCEVCGKNFPYKGRLKKHMLRHTDARPFHCETCGKQFRDSHSLRLHQKKHTGIGLHSCLECGKQFTNACHLRRHAKVHSGVKPHACDVCKRAFARTDNLEAHRRICTLQQQMKEKNSQHGFASSAWDPVGGAGQEVAPFAGLGTDDLLPPTMVKTAMAQSFES